jgi:hypothetical protein
MRLAISQILKTCSELPGYGNQRAQYLAQNDTLALRVVLQYALDPRVKFILPIGTPPYKPTDHLDQEGNLFRDFRKLSNFIEGGGYPDMHPIKRETLFVQFIEGLFPQDAELICSVKDKKIPYKGITAKLVNQAFPGLVKEKE